MRGGSRPSAKPWNSKEMAWLLSHQHVSLAEAADYLGRSPSAVGAMIYRLRGKGKISRSRIYVPIHDRVELLGARLRELHRAGYSDRDAARVLRVTRQTVSRMRGMMGLPPCGWSERARKKQSNLVREHQHHRVRSYMAAERLGWAGYTEAEAKVLAALFSKGRMTTRQIANELGVNWTSIQSGLRRRLRALHGRRVVVRQGRYWSLAPGIEPMGALPEDDGDEDE